MLINTPRTSKSEIRVLIADDSLVFRRFLEDMLSDGEDIIIAGVAKNGIEALDMVLKTSPDVILLDLEMPLMDGMTALQHLMIHRPTPSIMFSSLTEKGTARSFDTLKNGAVDFICKDFIFQKNNLHNHKKLLVDKVKKAALVKLAAREPAFPAESMQVSFEQPKEQVLFCEECGNRVIFPVNSQPSSITCGQCGDVIEPGLLLGNQYRRATFISVFGAGEGGFFNLLEIIPRLGQDIGGALLVVIHQPEAYVDGFAEYLDSISPIKVVRAREGYHIEGGYCYIIAGSEFMSVKPYSAQLTLQKVNKTAVQGGPFDTLLTSVSSVYKKRAAGIVLSGEEADGDLGIATLVENNGSALILNDSECYCKGMMRHILEKCDITETHSTALLIKQIIELHHHAKYGETAG